MIKVTKKELNNNYRVFTANYGSLQTLFSQFSPNYYNDGIYGINWEAYIFDNIAIQIGSRNMEGENISKNILDTYEDEAKKILRNNSNWKEVNSKLKKLIIKFINDLIAE